MAVRRAAIVTAAGASTRMGSFKALLNWEGRPLIAHQLGVLKDFEQVVVVTGHNSEALRPYLQSVDVAHNPDYPLGRASSLRCGARLVRPCHSLLICGVDQPLMPELVEALCLQLGDAPYIVPECGGKTGHPIVFRGDLLDEIASVSDATQGLRALTARHFKEARRLSWPDTRIWADLNTPEDYDQLCKAP